MGRKVSSKRCKQAAGVTRTGHIQPVRLKIWDMAVCRYYDVSVGSGPVATEGARVAVHYDARWRGVTFMTSRYVLRI